MLCERDGTECKYQNMGKKAEKGRMLVGSHSVAAWLRGLCGQGTAHVRGHTWWVVEEEEGESKRWFCSSAHASPCLGKPGQGLFVF